MKIPQGGPSEDLTWFDSRNPNSDSGKHQPVIVGLIIEHCVSVRLLVMTSKDHRFCKIAHQHQHPHQHSNPFPLDGNLLLVGIPV